MIYNGTDKKAFEKASKGWTKKSRSKKYQKYKAENEKKELEADFLFSHSLTNNSGRIRQPIINPTDVRTRYQQQGSFIEKRTILDDIRDYRSSKIVSNMSNSLATFIVKHGGRQWDNDVKNLVRSSIALAVSEVTNKVLEKPLKIVDNIKIYIKIGRTIYKIIGWIDNNTKLWATNDKSVSIVMEADAEYQYYLRQYPRLAESVRIVGNMSYKVGDIVLLNNGQIMRIISINNKEKFYYATCLAGEQKKYIITDAEIMRLATSLDFRV